MLMRAPENTDRMEFQPWRSEDLTAMLSICEQEEVMRYIDGPWDIDRVRCFIEGEQLSLTNDGVCRWAVWHKQDSCLMGFCGFLKRDNVLEMGWRFDPRFWRQGYGTEAGRHMVDWAFANTPVQLIFAKMHVLNAASYGLAEKIGMHRTARVPVAEYDDFRYEISRDSWNAERSSIHKSV